MYNTLNLRYDKYIINLVTDEISWSILELDIYGPSFKVSTIVTDINLTPKHSLKSKDEENGQIRKL